MLKQGHTAEDVMAELSRKYPVNLAVDSPNPEPAATAPAAPVQLQQANLEPAIQLAAAMGTEIAKSINEGLKGMLSCMDKANADLNAQNESIAGLKGENIQLKEKLSIMEAELVRLRKDRREMEKFLLDKLKNVTK